jgi:predicted peroxiredoxin
MAKVAFICNGSENSNLYPAFILGSAAAAAGDDVVIFFTPGGVPALRTGVLEGITGKGMPDMADLLEGIFALGGKLMLCELGLEAHDVTPEDLRDDIIITGATTFMAEIQDASNTFSF